MMAAPVRLLDYGLSISPSINSWCPARPGLQTCVCGVLVCGPHGLPAITAWAIQACGHCMASCTSCSMSVVNSALPAAQNSLLASDAGSVLLHTRVRGNGWVGPNRPQPRPIPCKVVSAARAACSRPPYLARVLRAARLGLSMWGSFCAFSSSVRAASLELWPARSGSSLPESAALFLG
jgi:hypothetical protein